jgi:Flp pilus assembly pilin Flp
MQGRRGVALVEYGMLVGLISAVAVGAVLALGNRTDFNFLIGALETSQINDPLSNFLDNGDFDDVSGMAPTAWGYSASSIAGWSEISGNGLNFEFHESGWQGVESVNGGYWLDTNASPGGLTITQQIDTLENDLVYKITLQAADRDPDLDGSADVYWNGILKGTLDPTVEDVMQGFTFYIREGEGDGANRVTIIDTGSNDSNGLSLDLVRIFGPE